MSSVTEELNNKVNKDKIVQELGTSESLIMSQKAVTDELNNKVDKATKINNHPLSGDITIIKSDIGIGNVDNTSDISKPISTSQQAALDGKLDKASVKQTIGTSTTDAMSQKAVTDAIALKEDKTNKQNSLDADGTNTKYPTVTAVNSGLALKESLANKQTTLTTDGTNTKYPTVDAVNNGLLGKEDTSRKQNDLTADSTDTKYPTVTAVNAGLELKADKTYVDGKDSLKEDKTNKQNDLTADGTNTKYPTITAVKDGLSLKADKTYVDSQDALKANTTDVTASLALKENTANKQNSLATDGSGVKFPTVDAVNGGLALKANSADVTNSIALKADKSVVDELLLGSGYYYVSGWDPNSLSPTPMKSLGNKAWLENLSHVYIFDMTNNTGTTMTPSGELQKANWLRYIDGSFAPTVGITEAMRATCDVALYLDAAHTNLYSAAGAFNAATFYNTYGINTPLYDGNGASVRILRPWETTSTNLSIGVAFSEKVWLIDGLGASGTYWQGLSQHEITWDGVKGVALERTAINPCPVTTFGGKTRCFFYLYNTGDSNTASSIGKNNICTLFSNIGRTFPRVNDMQQVTNMNYARANNSVVTNPYPVAEGGYHALNAAIIRREVLFGTRYLHNPSLFGSGISSNDTCNNEGTFLANGGFKYKVTTDTTWSYCTLGANPSIYYNNAAGITNASDLLNQQYPKEQCLESQMAASFAKETGVLAGTDFTFYGSTYQFGNVTGVLGLADGRMNVIVTKVMSQTISAFNAVGVATNYDIACCLRMSLIDGMNASGDIYMYAGGGYEQVGTCISTVSGHNGDTIDLYLQPDQMKWTNTTDVTKNSLGTFDFEKAYLKMATVTNLGNNFTKTRQSLTPWKVADGGSLSTGQCFYGSDSNYWSTALQQRVRLSARFRGNAAISNCSPRFMYASKAVSIAYQSYGGSAQILIG